jgi:casein kinase II subunit beta
VTLRTVHNKCNGQPCSSCHTSDVPRVSTVKVFCPKCEDISFTCAPTHQNSICAFFGTTFPTCSI